MSNIPDALQSLRPGAEWNLRGPDYSSLEWLDATQIKPTAQEVNDEITRLDGLASAEVVRQAGIKADSGAQILLNQVKTASVSQIDTWLTNNVTTLAQARIVLAAIIKVLAIQIG